MLKSSMRMHVSSPKIPKCSCYAMHTQKVTFDFFPKVVSKIKENKLVLGDRIDHNWHRIFGHV
jgi:hypothetical protein